MTEKIMQVSERVIVIAIQLITYLALTFGIYNGILGKPSSQMVNCLIIFIPVIVAYLLRGYVNNYVAFMAVHIVMLVISVMIGKTDAQRMSYLFVMLAICVNSISLRSRMNKKMEYSNTPMTEKDITSVNDDEKNIAIMSGERMHPAYAAVLVVFYMDAEYHGYKSLMTAEAVLFVMFVIVQLVYNQLHNLNDVFIHNSGKSEFPAHQMIVINVFTLVFVAACMIIGMALFYNGKYGNIFTAVGTLLMALLRSVLKAFVFIVQKIMGNNNPVYTPEKDMSEDIDLDMSGAVTAEDQNNPVMQAAFEAVGMVLIIAIVAAICYSVIKFVKSNKKTKENFDEIEFIESDKKVRKIFARSKTEQKEKLPVNEQYRKLYKKKVKAKLNKEKVDYTMTPDEITRKHITSDDSAADYITQSYEKARYSNLKISKEEIEYLKKIK